MADETRIKLLDWSADSGVNELLVLQSRNTGYTVLVCRRCLTDVPPGWASAPLNQRGGIAFTCGQCGFPDVGRMLGL